MKRLRHEAARRLKPYRRSAAVIGAAGYLTAVLCLLAGYMTQHTVQAIPQVVQQPSAQATRAPSRSTSQSNPTGTPERSGVLFCRHGFLDRKGRA